MIQTKRNKQTDVGKREFPVRKQSQDACSIAEYTHMSSTHHIRLEHRHKHKHKGALTTVTDKLQLCPPVCAYQTSL